MQRLEVSGAVRPVYGSLGVKRLRNVGNIIFIPWGSPMFFDIDSNRSELESVSPDTRSHWPIAINLKMNEVNSKMFAVDFFFQSYFSSY